MPYSSIESADNPMNKNDLLDKKLIILDQSIERTLGDVVGGKKQLQG